ncbi:MAG: hypothetical protein A2452_02770 [Candidatus Firestonebacteria bacterium RIFOXYC2_FULL_39_67]|nr:MAG: hypothetical protein A2536_02185 [Candidatus Firestonebacteria bacterium RIFOXYD2_FULL_39_29]OGF55382.1 MAG: hypothetical protein A2452_02770 [Candidatus Firestonebacteria bacterium RIFOXYC2_FULL_39_67]
MKKLLLILLFPVFIFADWSPSGLSGSTISMIAIDPSNNNIVYAVSNYLYKTSDAGISWVQVGGGTIYYVYDIEIKSDGTVYVTCPGGLYKSADGGLTWSLLNGALAGRIALTSTNTIIATSNLYSTVLMISTDGGSLWGTKALPDSSYDLKCHGSTIYATYFHICAKSTDMGTTFITIGNDSMPGFPAHLHYGKMAFAGNNIFIANSEDMDGSSLGIYFYDAGSGLWYERNTGLLNRMTTSITYTEQSELYVGTTGGGVLKSVNNGSSWTQEITGLTDYNINALDSCASAVYAGTNSGIFKLTLSGTTQSQGASITLKPINNVFNPDKTETCTINWSLTVDATASLYIYNLKGELVNTFVNGDSKVAGSYQSIWDGKDSNGSVVSSGIYLVYLKAGGKSTWKKIAIVR